MTLNYPPLERQVATASSLVSPTYEADFSIQRSTSEKEKEKFIHLFIHSFIHLLFQEMSFIITISSKRESELANS